MLPSTHPPAPQQATTDKPSLIKVSTLIGYGSPNKADTHDVHGAPLGASETAATRENLKWPYGEFEVRSPCWLGVGRWGEGWAWLRRQGGCMQGKMHGAATVAAATPAGTQRVP